MSEPRDTIRGLVRVWLMFTAAYAIMYFSSSIWTVGEELFLIGWGITTLCFIAGIVQVKKRYGK